MDCEGQRLSPVPPSGAAEELIKVPPNQERPLSAFPATNDFSSSASSSTTLLRGVVVKRSNPLTHIPSFMEIEHAPKRRRRYEPSQEEKSSSSSLVDAPAQAALSGILHRPYQESTTAASTITCHRPDPPAEHADLASALASVNLASPQKKNKARNQERKKREESDTSSLSSVETEPERVEDDSNSFYEGLVQWAMHKQQQQQEHQGIHNIPSGSLVNWMETMRDKYRLQKLPDEQIAVLNAMGFVWEPTTTRKDTSEEAFQARLVQLAEYKNAFPNISLSIPMGYRDPGLVQWVDAVRAEFQQYQATGRFPSHSILNCNRLALLQAIGLPFDTHKEEETEENARMNPPTTRVTDHSSSERHKRLRRDPHQHHHHDHNYQSE